MGTTFLGCYSLTTESRQKSIHGYSKLLLSNPRQHWVLRNKPSMPPWPWWRHQIETFPRYWSFVRGIHWSPVNSPHSGQWRGILMLSLICVWANGWVNNWDTCDLGRHRAHYDATVMTMALLYLVSCTPPRLSTQKKLNGIKICTSNCNHGLLSYVISHPC